jgi:type I restriction enzyme S subunit
VVEPPARATPTSGPAGQSLGFPRLLDLLAEKRKAIIATAVTRGIDPEARMAPTGIEWIPEAPSHWRLSRIGRLFRQSKTLGCPELAVLSVYREYGVIERSSRDDNANVLPDDLAKYQLVEADDLVVNKMKAWQGSLGVSGLRGITSPDYVVFRPAHSEFSAYLHFLLRNPRLVPVYLSNSNGIRTNQWRIEPERFLNIPVLLPPLAEQRAIVAHIARETAKLDAVRAATERTIALLKERRSALIAAAVTGQLEVGSAA